jgi:hypothetical protein
MLLGSLGRLGKTLSMQTTNTWLTPERLRQLEDSYLLNARPTTRAGRGGIPRRSFMELSSKRFTSENPTEHHNATSTRQFWKVFVLKLTS